VGAPAPSGPVLCAQTLAQRVVRSHLAKGPNAQRLAEAVVLKEELGGLRREPLRLACGVGRLRLSIASWADAGHDAARMGRSRGGAGWQ
jgi:hypothetical protein